MSTIAEPQATPGIAGRYFVTERRMRFERLTARVTLFNVTGLPRAEVTLDNKSILSPRRIARALGLGGRDANKVADTIESMMRRWSLAGFPTREVLGDPTLREVDTFFGHAIGSYGARVRLQDGDQR